jgi:branched-chain amino acid transport system substrate-binding protein
MIRRSLGLGVAIATLASAVSFSAQAETIKVAFIDPLSGGFAATGQNGLKQYKFIAGELNKAGGPQFEVIGFDNKISPKESLIQLKRVIADGIQYVAQGNSSGVANALTDAINKHNKRNPDKRVLFLNYSAVDPKLTNEKCNFWHFRFDANADMKMNALTDVIADDKGMKSIYLLGQNYSFGKSVAAAAVRFLGEKRPDVKIVGNELHPIGKVKDFTPYVAKIKASGAQALITGNWGGDMLNLAKAIDASGLKLPTYTYYAAADGITKAIGAGGVGSVRLVGQGSSNPPGTSEWDAMLKAFKVKYPEGDVTQSRIFTVMRMLKTAITKSGSSKPIDVARTLEGMEHMTLWGDKVKMRASDHQLQMPIRIFAHSDRNIQHDLDNSGFGLLNESTVTLDEASTPTICKMKRPS